MSDFNPEFAFSFYPDLELRDALGFKSSFDMADTLKDLLMINYPEMMNEELAYVDPERDGFMVYCTSKDVRDVVVEEFNIIIKERLAL